MRAAGIALWVGVLLLSASACCISGGRGDKIGVVVSIPPQAEMVERIGGEHVSASIMVPPGADPHTYEPRPSQLVSLSDAALYALVGSGLGFELGWMDRIQETNKGMLVINCSKGIGFIESQDPDQAGTDPHVWTSVRNAKIMAINIYQGLSSIDPGRKAYYQDNLDRYLADLESLDRNISRSLSGKTNKKFLVYHPAWGYFARDYGLEQVAIEEEGKEPSPRWMMKVIDEARKENVTVVFASPSFSTASAETIAEEIDGRVVLIDPLSKDYMSNMRNVSLAFAET